MGSCYSNQIVFNDGRRLLPIYDKRLGGAAGIVGLALVSADSNTYSRVRIRKYNKKSKSIASTSEQENEDSL